MAVLSQVGNDIFYQEIVAGRPYLVIIDVLVKSHVMNEQKKSAIEGGVPLRRVRSMV